MDCVKFYYTASSDAEKKKLTKELNTYIVGSVVFYGLLAIIIILNLTMVHIAFQFFASFLAIMGLVYSVTSVVKLRQLTGKMDKKSFNNYIIVLLIILAVCVAFAVFFILLELGIPCFGWTVE